MLANGVTYGVMAATLIAVAAYAITVGRHMEINSVKNFVRFASLQSIQILIEEVSFGSFLPTSIVSSIGLTQC